MTRPLDVPAIKAKLDQDWVLNLCDAEDLIAEVDRLQGELAQRRAVCASPQLQRLQELARTATHAEHRYVYEDGNCASRGHHEPEETCPHEDCVLVRAALTPAATKD